MTLPFANVDSVERMGFEIVNSPDEADAIILESDQFDASVFGKKPIIIVGGVAMQNWRN